MHFKVSAAVVGLAALMPTEVAGFFRMPCPGRLVTQRADPIISPGVVSGHIHQIAGGNGFGFSETYQQARNSTCSSCPLKADLSNYWTPVLYYKSQNGSFTKVPQSGDGPGLEGGMTVYYQQRGTASQIKAFPEGFRMVAGNPFKRNYTDDFAGQAVSFVCLGAPSDGAYTNKLPTQACSDGLRAQVYFPSCWDGVNLDSPDHSSHVVYPESGSYNGGTCPSSHPVQLVSIFFEVIFSTISFDWWAGDYGTGQPFVFSMGDPTGYGFHGDFINGWDVPTLQTAVDTCLDPTLGSISLCPILANNMFTNEESQACQIPTSVDEDIYGPFDAMPGCNPVSAGPGMASMATNCPVTPISKPQQYFTDMTSQGWEYVGCVNDTGSTRVLDGYTNMYDTDQSDTTVESCTSTCKTKGFTYAGMEDGKQCFCGNSIPTTNMPVAGVIGSCSAPCSGNSSEICGGAGGLSTYKSCSGSSCVNAEFQAINPSIEGEDESTSSGAGGTYSAPSDTNATSATSSASAASGSDSASSSAGSAGAGYGGSSSSTAGAGSGSGSGSSASMATYGNMPTTTTTSKVGSATGYGDKVHKSSTLASVAKSSSASTAAANANSGSGSDSGSDSDGSCPAGAAVKTVYVTRTVEPTPTADANNKRGKKHAHGKHLKEHQHRHIG